MTTLTKRILALALALVLALSAAACTPELELPDPTEQPAATPAASPTAAPTEEVGPTAFEALAAIDLLLFEDYITSDPLTFKLQLKDPDAFGFEKPEVSWGNISYEEAVADAEETEALLAELRAIDRSALTEDEQLTYDTIEQELESYIAGIPYYYYEEILSPYSGLHSNLPFNFIFFTLEDEEDVETYLALLEDSSRYIAEETLHFEQEKAARGLFMTEATLDQILDQIADFVAAGDTCFLLATFADSIDELDFSAEAEAAYVARNAAAVANLISAYQTLYDGLEALRGSAKAAEGFVTQYGEEGAEFFAQGLAYAACSDVTPEEALEILEAQCEREIVRMQTAYRAEPEVLEQFDTIDLSIGDTSENIAMLEALMEGYYPALPAHTVEFTDVPEELEDQLSPAAYLVPPVDDASENTIVINTKSMEQTTQLLDTIAHEGYPGHLYHYIYLRSIADKTGWYRQSMNLTGYFESWSQHAEDFFDANNTSFSNNYCVFMTANTRLSGLLLPAIVSIGVNGLGWTEADAQEYVIDYFGEEAAVELGSLYFQIAIDDPFYYLEYAMGYSILQEIIEDAQTALGSDFDWYAFHEAFLNLGPSYFNLLAPRMEAWADAQ